MIERPLTTEDGAPVRLGGGGPAGELVSLVCPECGYAELRGAGIAGMPDHMRGPERMSAPDSTGRGSASRIARLERVLASRGLIRDVEPKRAGVFSLIALAVSAAFMVSGIVWIYQASGPVMEAGGFVATGGPYVIAHPAEDWIWLPTMGATLMSFAVVGNCFAAASLNRPATVSILVFWTALFGSSSSQFLKYGINAPGGGQSWTWIILGVMFALFAAPTLLMLLLPATWRRFTGAFAWANAIGAVTGFVGAFWLWGIAAG
jgi:hypothetical protein